MRRTVAPLGKQHREAGAEDRLVGEEFEFAAELAVIALRRLFDAGQVRLQVRLRWPTRWRGTA